jgi:hypothetical protein
LLTNGDIQKAIGELKSELLKMISEDHFRALWQIMQVVL